MKSELIYASSYTQILRCVRVT